MTIVLPINPQDADTIDVDRRFGGIARLYGEQALLSLRQAHVCVIGVGGVGSWAVEALARSAIGKITMIDLDNLSESNINRQIHALTDTLGKPKVDALAERISQINPYCVVTRVEEFIDPDNVAALIPQGQFALPCVIYRVPSKNHYWLECANACVVCMVFRAGQKINFVLMRCIPPSRCVILSYVQSMTT